MFLAEVYAVKVKASEQPAGGPLVWSQRVKVSSQPDITRERN